MNLVRLPTRTRRPLRSRGAAVLARTAAARAVPWRVVRRDAGAVEVEHRGEGPLHSVRFALAGAGVLGLSLPRTV